jgi:hypothetical protein
VGRPPPLPTSIGRELRETRWSVPVTAAGAILVAHSGMDRMMGYGLKLPSSFKDTHLGRITGSTKGAA